MKMLPSQMNNNNDKNEHQERSDEDIEAEDKQPLLNAIHGRANTRHSRTVRKTAGLKCGLHRRAIAISGLALVFGLVLLSWPFAKPGAASGECNTDQLGYNCNTPMSHQWGQYSPYFSVASDIKDPLPSHCNITFVQMLARHGARSPTASKSVAYEALIRQIRDNVHRSLLVGKYAFLDGYKYNLGADDLTAFGEDEMFRSGRQLYDRYKTLSRSQIPFIRASGQDRVIVSAQRFASGYHSVKRIDPKAGPDPYPYDILVIPESPTYNNTLDHSTCTGFENGSYDHIPDTAYAAWLAEYAPKIQTRINADLPGAELTLQQIVYLMDLCPFATLVPQQADKLSPFCRLFTELEWEQYDYLQSLGKYYSNGKGHPLGPTQGVGFVNELIARLTGHPVQDETSVNHTLDNNPDTFPLGGSQAIFADFSHDTQMTSIFFALNLFSQTHDLPTDRLEKPSAAGGYSSSHTVPFSGRMYFEKMTCADQKEDLVRVLINDRVVPLPDCGADNLGRCTLSAYIETLSYARRNGDWQKCYSEDQQLESYHIRS